MKLAPTNCLFRNGDNIDALPGYNCHECAAQGVCSFSATLGSYSCHCPINSALDGRTACNDGDQCVTGGLGQTTCDARGLQCNELVRFL